jgi:hypothetical protein
MTDPLRHLERWLVGVFLLGVLLGALIFGAAELVTR